MLLIEGALRKWVLPSLASPLLIVRDPIAIWIIYQAYRSNQIPNNSYLSLVFIVTIISIITTLGFGHGNLIVAFYGARIFLIHFPLMFIIGKVFNREDVVNLGKITLILSIPMAVLIGVQFYSPQSAWVNIGIGGEGSSGFSGAGGFFRPSGLFSFTIGNVQFFQLVTSFLFYFLINNNNVNKYLIIAAAFALILAIPLSISRTLLFNLGIVIFFLIIASFRKRKYILKLLNLGFIGVIAILILSQTSVFKTSTGAFTERIETASEHEGGAEGILLDRILGGLLSAIDYAARDEHIFGKGLGMGTNAGSQLLNGKVEYLIAEGEWGRMVGEMGPILGLLVIFLRLQLGISMLSNSFIKIRRDDVLPWMLSSFGVYNIIQGLWAQPTCLGFSTLAGGLIIASFNNSD